MILYVETNLLVGFAKGPEPRMAELLDAVHSGLRIVLPSICIMEALSVFDAERRARNRFTNELQTQLTQLRRDVTSPHSASLVTSLDSAVVANTGLLNDIQARLALILERMSGLPHSRPAELIDLPPRSLGMMLRLDVAFILNPTDTLILQTILNHARQDGDPVKAMLTGNTNDFATPETQNAMQRAGINFFFPNTEAVLGWLQGHPEEDA